MKTDNQSQMRSESKWGTEWMDIEYQTLREAAKYFSECLSFSSSLSPYVIVTTIVPWIKLAKFFLCNPKGPNSNTDTAIISVKRKVTSQ